MIQSMHDIDKIIGDAIVKQAQIDRQNVINALSVNGAELSKFISDTVKVSYELTDCAIVFEVKPSNDDSINFSEEEQSHIRESICEEVEINIYGSQSSQFAKCLKARFESEKCRNDLLSSSVYLSKVSDIVSMTEFMNNRIWPRASFSLSIAFEMNFEKVDDFFIFEEVSFNADT